MLKGSVKFPARVVLDTGPFLLFLAGNHDPEMIPGIKRLKYDGGPCNEVHYDILMQYLNHTKERIITPGILSEAWNLIDNDISNKKDKKELFDFGQAIKYLKDGKRVQRQGWNGKGQYIELATNISYKNTNNETINAEHDAIGNKAIAFVGTSGVQLGWLASQADMLAEDWRLVELGE